MIGGGAGEGFHFTGVFAPARAGAVPRATRGRLDPRDPTRRKSAGWPAAGASLTVLRTIRGMGGPRRLSASGDGYDLGSSTYLGGAWDAVCADGKKLPGSSGGDPYGRVNRKPCPGRESDGIGGVRTLLATAIARSIRAGVAEPSTGKDEP